MRLLLSITLVLLSLNGVSQGLQLSKAKDALQKEEYNQAIFYCNTALAKDTLNFEIYNTRASALFNIGKYNLSMLDYQKSIKLKAKQPIPYFGIANIFQVAKGKPYKAIEFYTKSLDICLAIKDDEYACSCYLMRGLLKKKLGDIDGFLEDMKEGSAMGSTICKDMIILHELD